MPVEDHQNQLEGAFALLEQSEPHAMDFQGAEPMGTMLNYYND